MQRELTDPFLLLLEMEKRARKYAHKLPLSQDIKREETFIRFHLGEYCLATDLGHVAEIARVPALTRIPGVYSWVSGLANIRGHLIAVIDLGELLFNKKIQTSSRNRILVVNHQNINCGILVEHVEGLQNLSSEDCTPIVDRTNNGPEKFLIASIKQQPNSWVVNLSDLLAELQLYERKLG